LLKRFYLFILGLFKGTFSSCDYSRGRRSMGWMVVNNELEEMQTKQSRYLLGQREENHKASLRMVGF
jgi:hypothetical protein